MINFSKTILYESLKQTFFEVAQQYTADVSVIESDWAEIEQHYTSKKRHYHTLTHLENLLTRLTEVKNLIQDWNVIVFSIVYHDIIYNVLKQGNEEKSALFAQKKLQQLGVPAAQVERCVAQIIATKSHQVSPDPDTNLFTDADLSVLGQDWATYQQYYQQVRQEYSLYPDFLYNPGRRKVLQHFLAMNRIFKTEFFFQKFEQTARQNLQRELDELSA